MAIHTLEGIIGAVMIFSVLLIPMHLKASDFDKLSSVHFLEEEFFYRNISEVKSDLKEMSLFMPKALDIEIFSGNGSEISLNFSNQNLEKSNLYISGNSFIEVKLNANLIFSGQVNGIRKIEIKNNFSENNNIRINSSKEINYLLENFIVNGENKSFRNFVGKIFSGNGEIRPKVIFIAVME